MEKYKTFFPRFVALLIDTFIMMPIVVFDDWFRKAEFPDVFFYFWIPLSSLVAPVYTILMHGFYGQTLGKMWMNVKVLDVSEKPMTMRQSFLRQLPQVIFNICVIVLSIMALPFDLQAPRVERAIGIYSILVTVWGMTDIFVFLSNEKRRALHDFIGGTVAVKTNI